MGVVPKLASDPDRVPDGFKKTGFSSYEDFIRIFGSCVATVRFQVIDTHSLNQMGRDPFRIQHGFIGGHIEM